MTIFAWPRRIFPLGLLVLEILASGPLSAQGASDTSPRRDTTQAGLLRLDTAAVLPEVR